MNTYVLKTQNIITIINKAKINKLFIALYVFVKYKTPIIITSIK